MASNRIPPTPEDNEILQRHIRRVLRAIDAKHPNAKGTMKISVLRAAMGDYLHFGPKEDVHVS